MKQYTVDYSQPWLTYFIQSQDNKLSGRIISPKMSHMLHIFSNSSLSVVHLLDKCFFINLKFLYFRKENWIIQINPNAGCK